MSRKKEISAKNIRVLRKWALRLTIFAVLFISLPSWYPTCSLALGYPDPPNPNLHISHHDDLNHLYENLRAIAHEEKHSMHRFLWRATLLVRPCVVGRPWPEVKAQLDKQPAILESGDKWGDHIYDIPAVNCTSLSKVVHTFHLSFSTHSTEELVETVEDASALLGCWIDQPYSQLMERKLFRVGSPGDKFFKSPSVQRTAANYPQVREVSFSYVNTVNRVISRWLATVKAGIEVWATFEVDEGPDKRGDYTIILGAASGLQPERTHTGKNVEWLVNPRDTLGTFRPSGYSGFGSGWSPDR